MINTGLGTFEPSEQEIGSLYNQTRTGFWESAGATFYNAWNYNPTSSVFRAVDQSQAYQSSNTCLLYTSPSPRDGLLSRMPSSA